jgi:hypothetical protein
MSDWIERWEWQAEQRSKPHLRKVYGNWWCVLNDLACSSSDMRCAYKYLMTSAERTRKLHGGTGADHSAVATTPQKPPQTRPARDVVLDASGTPKAAGDPFSAILGVSWRDRP